MQLPTSMKCYIFGEALLAVTLMLFINNKNKASSNLCTLKSWFMDSRSQDIYSKVRFHVWNWLNLVSLWSISNSFEDENLERSQIHQRRKDISFIKNQYYLLCKIYVGWVHLDACKHLPNKITVLLFRREEIIFIID